VRNKFNQYNMSKTFRFSTVFLFLGVAAMSLTSADCNPDIDPGLVPGEMKANATVEGSFFANDAFAVSGAGYTISASMPYAAINGDLEINLYIPKGTTIPHTFNVATTDAVINYCLKSSNSCINYQASKSGGSGTITINSVSPHVTGTFSGTLPNLVGGDSRVLSNGEFIAKF
jgi:hypothetical protein